MANYTRITITLDPESRALLYHLSRKYNTNRSQAARLLIRGDVTKEDLRHGQ